MQHNVRALCRILHPEFRFVSNDLKNNFPGTLLNRVSYLSSLKNKLVALGHSSIVVEEVEVNSEITLVKLRQSNSIRRRYSSFILDEDCQWKFLTAYLSNSYYINEN